MPSKKWASRIIWRSSSTRTRRASRVCLLGSRKKLTTKDTKVPRRTRRKSRTVADFARATIESERKWVSSERLPGCLSRFPSITLCADKSVRATRARRRRDGRVARSEERRVGKECRSRWSPDDEKKKSFKQKTSQLMELQPNDLRRRQDDRWGY